MDRRQALKKLGAGGAIAVGASVVLSSTDVAYAASGVPPASGATFQLENAIGNEADVRVSLPTVAGCTPTGYSWTLDGFSLQPPGNTIATLTVATGNPGRLQKFKKGDPEPWDTGRDSVSVTVVVTWDCGGPVSYSGTATF